MKRFLFIAMLILIPFFMQAKNRIVVSKSDFTLAVISEKGDTLYSCIIAYGKNPGNKTTLGDCKTPEGTFKVKMIYDATSWKHDFGDEIRSICTKDSPFSITKIMFP